MIRRLLLMVLAGGLLTAGAALISQAHTLRAEVPTIRKSERQLQPRIAADRQKLGSLSRANHETAAQLRSAQRAVRVLRREQAKVERAAWMRKQARKAWAAAAVGAFIRGESLTPPLEPIGLHELRHSYVSLMHDAGFSLERIGDYVGHSSAYMTDAYRHLLEGHEAEAAERFEDYLSKSTGAHTGAQSG